MPQPASINTIKGLLGALESNTHLAEVDLPNFKRILFLMRKRNMPIPTATVICHHRRAFVTFQGFPNTIVTVVSNQSLTRKDFSRLPQLTFHLAQPEQSQLEICRILFKKPMLKFFHTLRQTFAAMEVAEAATRRFLLTTISLFKL